MNGMVGTLTNAICISYHLHGNSIIWLMNKVN